MKMRPLILTLAAVLTASSALAQMSDVDTDEDGMASYDEVIAVYPGVGDDCALRLRTVREVEKDHDPVPGPLQLMSTRCV